MALLVACGLFALRAISIHALSRNPCFDHNTCESCLTDIRCKWVTNMIQSYKESLDTQRGKQHCVLRESQTTFENDDIYTPPTFTPNLGRVVNTAGLQITPVTASIKTYTGHKGSFTISVTPKQTTKLNIYFLLHLSTDIHDFSLMISDALHALVYRLYRISTEIKMGAGKFSDLSVFPFVKLPERATSSNPGDMSGYVFKNLQKLTRVPENPAISFDAFEQALKAYQESHNDGRLYIALKNAEQKKNEARTALDSYIDKMKGHFVQSANDAIDEPESVLDAIAQVTDCKNIIGWSDSDDVYKLMIVLTDTTSKRAGHGNIIGNYGPNDGSCKTSAADQTLKKITTDYIHPHLLEKSLSEKNIRVLILTKSELVDYYTTLTESFKHQVVGIKSFGVKENYELVNFIMNVASNRNRAIKFNVDDLKSKLDVVTVLKCTTSEQGSTESLFCPNVNVDHTVTLSVSVRDFKSTCGDKTISSYVKVNGFFHVRTTVEQFCECKCTADARRRAVNTADCSDHGELICGKCACNDEYEGDTCQCQKNVVSAGPDVECSDTKSCGRYGKCVCGKCVCPNSPEQFYGEGCSKSDLNCPITQNGLCNRKGSCVKSRCTCVEGFSGDDCSIEDSRIHEKCRMYANSEPCSGKGSCVDGICKCNKSFGGKYCEWYKIRTKGCDDFKKCMLDYFVSEQGNACYKPVETVDKITDNMDYYLPVCVALHKYCQRVYMLNFNYDGTDIEKITVQRLDRAKECHESREFKKTLIYVCLITAAVTAVIDVIVGFVFHFYFKKRQEQRSEEERHRRQWVLKSGSTAGHANDEAAPLEAS